MTQGIRIQPHSGLDYKMLPNRLRKISGKDRECLDELGALLVEHGRNLRFAISILHRHFEYSDEELCFATSSPDRQSVIVSPARRNDLEGQSITPISFRFVPGGEDGPLKLIGLEYAPLSDLGDIPPISEDDTACFEAIHRVLVRHDAVNIFGVVLRHIIPDITENLEWLEDSSHDTRISIRKLMNPSEIPKENVGTSNWAWTTKAMGPDAKCTGAEHFVCSSGQHCGECDPKDPDDDQKPAPEEPADQ